MSGTKSQQLLAFFCLAIWSVYGASVPIIDVKMLVSPKRVKCTALANRTFNTYFKNNSIANPKTTTTTTTDTSTTTNTTTTTTTTTTNTTTTGTISTGSPEKKEMGKKIFDLMRDYRKGLGLSDLTWNETSYGLCVDHTKYQIGQGQISHDNFSTRVKGFQTANENVAMFGTSKEVTDNDGASKFFTMWKNSPGHDANMKSKTINQGAVAVIYDSASKTYYSTMINVKVST